MSSSENTTGCLYLIPSALGEGGTAAIAETTRAVVQTIEVFVVEQERSARRFLRSIGYRKDFDTVEMIPVSKDEDFVAPPFLLSVLQSGKHVGVISEAGCPGIADPGAAVVRWAHQHHMKVVPLIGPSSVFLALMACGLNGQQFAFHGYLPVSSQDRKNRLHLLEGESLKHHQTQIFMETPYRNNALLHDLLTCCRPQTLLCLATDITLPSESILTQPVSAWKKNIPDLNKKPTIFLMLA